MAKEFRIYTRVYEPEVHWAAVKVPGTSLGFGLFACRDQGKSINPERRWKITDIDSGAAIFDLEMPKVPLRFVSLAECKEWVANIPEEYKAKIEAIRSSEKYKQLCQDFANLPKE